MRQNLLMNDGGGDKTASGESYDQYSHMLREAKLRKSMKSAAEMSRQVSWIMLSSGLVILLVSMMLRMTGPMIMGHTILVTSHTGGLYNILRYDIPFFDDGDRLPPGGGDGGVAQYPDQKRRKQCKKSLHGGYSVLQTDGGYRDLKREGDEVLLPGEGEAGNRVIENDDTPVNKAPDGGGNVSRYWTWGKLLKQQKRKERSELLPSM